MQRYPLSSLPSQSRESRSHYLDFSPHGGGGIPDIICHLVTEEPLDMLGLYPVCVLTLHWLPGGVMEPGAPHDLQARPRPVDGVTLPLLEVHLVYPAADHDEEVPLVPDEFFRSEVSLALFALPGGQVGRKFPSWRV